jgi:SAM-dependent methyltransferase
MRGIAAARNWQTHGAAGAMVSRRSDRPAISRNPLSSYIDGVSAGPGLWKWHHYLDIYHRHLSKFVDARVEVAEVGVYSGGSLRMWKQYFGSGCHVTGVDIQPACQAYEDASTTIYIGDQADRAFWRQLRAQVPIVDVLIDDGGHRPEQQMVTLEEMLPHLRPGGVYICEDIHGAGNRFASFAHSLAASLNASAEDPSRDGLAVVATPFQRAISSVHVYPFAIVIERTEQIVDGFEAPKRGTEWQSFLPHE